MKIILTFLDGPREGMKRSYAVDSISLGLDSDNRFVCYEEGDQEISSHHAEIRRQRGEFILIDNDSEAGTYVNQKRVATDKPSSLKTGDVIQLGKDGVQIQFDVDRLDRGTDLRKEKAKEKAHGRSIGSIFKDVLVRSKEMGILKRTMIFFREVFTELIRDPAKRRRLIFLIILLLLIAAFILGRIWMD